MKKISRYIHNKTKSMLAFMSVMVCLTLFAATTFQSWGANKTVVKWGHPIKKVATTFALVGLVAKFKSKGVTLTEDEEKQFGLIDEAFEAHTKSLIDSEELKAKFEEIKALMTPEAINKLVEKAAEEMNDALAKQAVSIEQLKTLGLGPKTPGKTLSEQLKEQLGTPEIKAALLKLKAKDLSAKGFEISVKAAGNETIAGTTAYTTAGTQIAFPTPEVIPGLNNVARNQPFIIQLLNVMTTQKENIVYTEKYNPQGAAGWVGENAASSQVSFDIRIGQSRAKMVTCYIKVSTQMLDDVDYMAAEIQKELIYQEAIAIDTALLSGDGAGDDLAGISSFAGGYVLTSLFTTIPNNCDAILAAATQIAHDNFRPDIAVLNPIDFNQTKMLKGTTGYYIVNPNNVNDTWAGIRVVQSNQVPVGTVMVMDSSKTNVYRYQDFTLSYGWINDDFIKHMVSIQATQRLHSFIKSNDTNAFVYDTLANIKAAITAV